MEGVRLIHGDCLEVLPTLETGSVDCVVTDPPYPCIHREYGYWTEDEWFAMMRLVVPECMRVLKPSGSAVFILQPNSERVGRMRTWLWEFMLWVGKEWGIVQDAWWWNIDAPPGGGEGNRRGLLRPSLKAAVWVGVPDCYRDRDSVLWEESTKTKVNRLAVRAGKSIGTVKHVSPGMHGINRAKVYEDAEQRGGVTPFNVLPIPHSVNGWSKFGHGAATPDRICRWWVRYICPPGGTVLDPFFGSGTVPLAAVAENRHAIGIEKNAEYHAIAQRRLDAESAKYPLFNQPTTEGD